MNLNKIVDHGYFFIVFSQNLLVTNVNHYFITTIFFLNLIQWYRQFPLFELHQIPINWISNHWTSVSKDCAVCKRVHTFCILYLVIYILRDHVIIIDNHLGLKKKLYNSTKINCKWRLHRLNIVNTIYYE